jgi:hypothetical protein
VDPVQKTLTSSEPAALGTLVVVFVNSVLALLTLFGVNISAEQLAGMNLVLVNLVALIMWFLVRRQVTSPYSVKVAGAPSPEAILPPPPV